MDDNRIKLGLDLGGLQQAAKETAKALGEIHAAASNVGESFVYAAAVGTDYETVVISAKEADKRAADAAKEAAAARKQAAREVAEAKREEARAAREAARESAAADKAAAAAARESTNAQKGRLNELSRGALQTSQALQDIAQGGPAAALNNTDGIVGSLAKSMGLSATAATTLSASILGVGTAVLVAGPPLYAWFKSLVDGTNEVPKGADALDRLNDAFNTAKERLAELKGQQSLTNQELEEYRKLLPEVTKLEKEANAEKERRNALDKARKAEADAANPSSPEAAKVAQEVIAGMGGIDDAVNATRNALTAEDPALKAMRAQAAELAKKAAQRYRDDPNNMSGEGFYEADQRNIQAKIDAAMKRLDARAVELATGAREGNRGAIGDLARLLPGAGFAGAEPAGLASAKEREAAVKREADRLRDEAKRKEDAAKARAKADEEQAKADAKEAEDEAKAQAIFDKGRQDYDSGLAKMEADRKAMDAKADTPEARRKAADRRDRQRLKMIGVNELDVELDDDQAAQALKKADEYIKAGMDPNDAARQGVAEVAAGLAATLQKAMESQEMLVGNQSGLADALNRMNDRQRAIQQQAQAVPSILDWGMGW